MLDYADADAEICADGENCNDNSDESSLTMLLMIMCFVFLHLVGRSHRSQDIEHGADFPVECGLFTPSVGLLGIIRWDHYHYHYFY